MPQASEEVQDSNNSTSQEDNSTSNIEDNSDTDASTDEAVESVISSYKVLGVANVTNYLNVREEASLDGKILGKLPMNAGCEILETLDGWYKVSSGNVEGYVSAEFLLTGKEANERAKDALATVAKVNADMLMVREEPNTECTILTRVAQDEEIEVVEVLSGWVKVNIDNKTGYVCADYVDVYDTLPKGVTLKELSYGDGVSSTAIELIEYAKQFLGNPYVYGGTSLTNGTDCSGFTMRIYQHFGYSLSRTSRQQAHNGRRVSLSEIQPGDLLFYNHGSQIGHVAIYIGNGQIIHASTERTGIIIGNAYYTTPACATRILN
jgi:cell wall-associated NlpC family hydrolase